MIYYYRLYYEKYPHNPLSREDVADTIIHQTSYRHSLDDPFLLIQGAKVVRVRFPSNTHFWGCPYSLYIIYLSLF